LREKISYLYALSPGKEDRLRVEATIDKGEIKGFVVQYEAFLQNRWHPIVRYDTAHGFAHRDILHPDRSEEKQLLVFRNFNHAFTFAIQDVKALWKQYRDGYERELKK